MEREMLKQKLLTLVNQLDTEDQTELQEKDILYSIVELCNARIPEITRDENGVPWMTRVHNMFIEDIYTYLMRYIEKNDIPLYGARLILKQGDSYHIFINTYGLRKQNLHGLEAVLKNDIRNKLWLRYIGADEDLKSISIREYDRFYEKKDSDPEYPQCFLTETIKVLHLLEPEK